MTDIDVDRYQGPLREATPSGHVGFDSLPDQVVNKATGAGFCFNILCVGETGIGKRFVPLKIWNSADFWKILSILLIETDLQK